MKFIKKIAMFIISCLIVMITCLTIDYSRVSSKQNPLFSFIKIYGIDEGLYPHNMYIGPLYYLTIENKTGTRTSIDIHESTKVEMGVWFKDSNLIFEQEFTYQ